MRLSVNDSPYYLGVPTHRAQFPIYSKHGRVVAHAATVEDADSIVYALNVRNVQFEDEDLEGLISELESAEHSLSTAREALERLSSPTGTPTVSKLIGGGK